MPIARIITRCAEDASAVIRRLHALGYRVETVAPGETSDHRADLEISLESQKPNTVLNRAAELLLPDADIYIAAGVFPAAEQEPNQGDSATRNHADSQVPNATDTVNGVAAGLQNKRDLLAKALRERRAAMRTARQQNERRQEAIMHESPASFSTPAGYPDRQSMAEPRLKQQNRSDELAPAKAQTAESVHAGQEARSHDGPVPQEPALQQVALDQGAAEPVTEAERSDSQALEVHEDAERVFTQATERIAAGAWTSQQVESSAAPAEQANSESIVVQSPRHGRRRLRIFQSRRKSGRRIGRAREWRSAVIVSSIFSVLLILGWARVTKGPLSPMPNSLSQSNVEEQVPFGSVTIKPASAPVPTAKPASEPEGPVVLTTTSQKPAASARRGSATVASKKSSKREAQPKRSVRRSSADDSIAEDVVVRHFAPQPSERPKGTQKASLKRYSDLK
ncbi:MAG TPA: hypothetical protein VFM10_07470 [Terriglobales bacterium]|nr:hypothetical protein [Terriglobales bacterium]